ncbi:uroporphyrinogen decarboxylase/cobalamine-independent methonine synthase family protein [Arthrobacter monumenti]
MSQAGQLTATALGSWPGTDPAEAMRVIRGELGSPHLPFLPQLPDRGVGADAVGRTAALLVELPVDVQPHGWRLVPRRGQDHRRAVSMLNTDVNTLADIIGAEETAGGQLKLQLRGPWSMAANLHLHHGERALSDAGARREILESLTAGLVAHIGKVAEVSRGADLVIQFDEPEIERVLTGGIPTASGYRTLRSVPEQEVLSGWRSIAGAARDAGAVEVAVSAPAAGLPLEKLDEAGLDAVGLSLDALSPRQWEDIAAAVESGRKLWAGVTATPDGGGTLPEVSALVEEVLTPWGRVGLPLHQLQQVRLTPSSALSRCAPRDAKRTLTRLTQAADALNQTAAG